VTITFLGVGGRRSHGRYHENATGRESATARYDRFDPFVPTPEERSVPDRTKLDKLMQTVRSRDLATEHGFTTVELLIVMLIIGIMIQIAVPSYLSFRTSAQTAAAKANIRTAVPPAEVYFQNNGSTFTGLVGSTLRTQSPGISPNLKAVALNTGQGYCLEDTDGASTYDYIGGTPGTVTGALATIQSGTCLVKAGVAAT
jgi:Tfp pilus assembly protein PilE